jgi:hypothetical protein
MMTAGRRMKTLSSARRGQELVLAVAGAAGLRYTARTRTAATTDSAPAVASAWRQSAERQSGLLDPHREPAPARRKPLHDGLARRRIQHAEAEARDDEGAEQARQAAGPRGRHHEHADQQQPPAKRGSHAEAIGEPAGRKRHQHAAEVHGRQEQTNLRAAQLERVEQKRRQRRHRQHR